MRDLPIDYSERIIEAFGDEGKLWLANLPQVFGSVCRDWKLRPAPDQPELSYNFVCRVIREDGSSAVLKIGIHEAGYLREVNSLNQFNGNGAVSVLEINSSRRSYLMEDISPGLELKTFFASGNDENATHICCKVIKKLLANADITQTHSYKKISTLAADFDTYLLRTDLRAIPRAEVSNAKMIYRRLIATTLQERLLHGDLHHQNILKSEAHGWLAIDPKGVFGDPCFEIGAFMRNPSPQIAEAPSLTFLLRKRALIFADELGFPPSRIVEWSYVQAMLAGVWALLDHGSGWEPWYRVSQAFLELQPEFETN